MTRKSMSVKSPATTPPISARTRRKSLAAGKTATPSSTPDALGNKRKSVATVKVTPAKDTPKKRKSVVPVIEEQVDSPKKLKNSPVGTPKGKKKSLMKESPMPKKIKEVQLSEKVESEEDEQEEEQDTSDSEDEASETEPLSVATSPRTLSKAKNGTQISRPSVNTKEEIPSDEEESAEEDEESLEDQGKPSETKPRQNGSTKKSAKISNDASKRDRTIFVGNLPKEVSHKEVAKLFSKYGKISSLRLRSAPVADSRVPKKVAVIKKDFHAERTNINAYVMFEEVASAKEALEVNGTKIFDRHIRVAMLKAPPMDRNKAIFIGNLNFGADEEQLHKVFEECGTIVSVRIVRDQVRGIGRGFAYVNFETTGAVELGLLKDGIQVDKRPIRVQRCKETQMKKRKRSKKSKKAPEDGAETSESPNPKPGKQDNASETSYAGQKVGDKGKVHKKGGAKKLTPMKKQAIETLAKTMPGSMKKKSAQKGFTRYFNQEVK